MAVKHGLLTDYFEGFGYKIIKPVEIDPEVSHEHEFNGINSFKEILGYSKQRLLSRVIYLSDNEDEIIEDSVLLTWYDARENHPTRTEYRLYYPESDCFLKAVAGDIFVVCKNRQNDEYALTLFIAKEGDTIANQLLWVFGIAPRLLETTGKIKKIGYEKSMDYFSNLILSKVGIEIKDPDDSMLDKILENFPDGFPKTNEFSEFTRSFATIVSAYETPGEALIQYMDHEECLFRVLEKHLVGKKLKTGFADVDDFISFSLSVQNRRKSRAGYAFENHLKHIFKSLGIKHSYNVVTENKSRPDFLFPGILEYRNDEFPAENLTMLGVKTTCKERWRQVLAEAKRIPRKHLCTLEPGISETQTEEMISSNLRLVIPISIFSTYTANQQKWLLTLSDFINLVREREIPGQ